MCVCVCVWINICRGIWFIITRMIWFESSANHMHIVQWCMQSLRCSYQFGNKNKRLSHIWKRFYRYENKNDSHASINSQYMVIVMWVCSGLVINEFPKATSLNYWITTYENSQLKSIFGESDCLNITMTFFIKYM